MGYSTTQIEIPKALKLAKDKQVVSASKLDYFGDNTWKGKIVRAEISDHFTQRIYFTLANGDFVEME